MATRGTENTKEVAIRSEAEQAVLSLCDRVRETAFELHHYLRHGHLERVYENGLAHRLRTAGLVVVQQHPISVLDTDGTVLGDYYVDLLVDNRLVIEVKACSGLCDEHTAQVLGYLRSCRLEHGLLINFGAPKLQIRKFIQNDL